MPENSPHIVRYAIYTRQSVDREDNLGSCEVQFMVCRETAKETNGPDIHWIGQRFDDEGYSGSTMDRPAMQKLRKVINLGGIDCLYAVALDRLSRNMLDAVVLLDELDRAGVELRLVYQSGLTSGAEHRFLRHILAAFAEFERDMTASRIADSRAYLKAHDRRLAGKVPYGYDVGLVTKQLVPNDMEAERVRLIFQRAADSQLPSQIAAELNKLGWPTKVYESRRSGRTSGGGKWTARTVLAVLRNPTYLGRFRDGGGTRAGCHEPIVNQALFDRAGQALDSRRIDRGLKPVGGGFALRKKIVCPQCGRRLTTRSTTHRISRGALIGYSYYCCGSTAGGQPPCKGIEYRAYDLERMVRQGLCHESTWRRLLGPDATPEDVQAACTTMRSFPEPWLNTVMSRCVERVEINRDATEGGVIFVHEACKALLTAPRPRSARENSIRRRPGSQAASS